MEVSQLINFAFKLIYMKNTFYSFTNPVSMYPVEVSLKNINAKCTVKEKKNFFNDLRDLQM